MGQVAGRTPVLWQVLVGFGDTSLTDPGSLTATSAGLQPDSMYVPGTGSPSGFQFNNPPVGVGVSVSPYDIWTVSGYIDATAATGGAGVGGFDQSGNTLGYASVAGGSASAVTVDCPVPPTNVLPANDTGTQGSIGTWQNAYNCTVSAGPTLTQFGGSGCIQMVNQNGANGGQIAALTGGSFGNTGPGPITVTPGQAMTASAQIVPGNAGSTGNTALIYVIFFDSSGAHIASSEVYGPATPTPAATTTVTVSFVVPTGAATMSVAVEGDVATHTTGSTYFVGNVMVYTGAGYSGLGFRQGQSAAGSLRLYFDSGNATITSGQYLQFTQPRLRKTGVMIAGTGSAIGYRTGGQIWPVTPGWLATFTATIDARYVTANPPAIRIWDPDHGVTLAGTGSYGSAAAYATAGQITTVTVTAVIPAGCTHIQFLWDTYNFTCTLGQNVVWYAMTATINGADVGPQSATNALPDPYMAHDADWGFPSGWQAPSRADAGHWADITNWVRTLRTQRGRQHELDRFATGTATIELWDADTRFTPWATSPYKSGSLPAVIPGRPVQIRATTGGTTYTVWTGVADTWTVGWPDETATTVTLGATDHFNLFANAVLQQNPVLFSNAYVAEVEADGAGCLYRLGEVTGNPVDTTGNTSGASYSGAVTHGTVGPIVTDAATATTIPYPSYLTLPTTVPTLGPSSTGWTWEGWVKFPAAVSGPTATLWNQDQSGLAGSCILTVTPTTGTNQAVPKLALNNGTAPFTATSTGYVPTDGAWHHLAVVVTCPGTVTFYIDGGTYGSTSGLTASNLPGAATAVKVPGMAAAGNLTIADLATYPTAVTAAKIGNHYTAGTLCQNVEPTGTRISEALTVVGWPAAARNINAGSSNVQATSSSLATTSALSYMQTVELTENGALFMSAAGQVRFLARHTIHSTNPGDYYNISQATFGDNVTGGEIPFDAAPQLAIDTLDLFNTATVTAAGGNPQTSADLTSVQQYGPRTYNISGLLLTSDTEAASYAAFEVARLAQPVTRLRQITVHPSRLATVTAAGAAVLARELLDRVTVNRHSTPGGGTTFSQVALLEGIGHQVDFGNGDWVCTLALSPTDAITPGSVY